MPMPDTATTTGEIESAIRALDRELIRLRIPRRDRAEVVTEVGEDLRAGAADGLTPDALLGDVATFAREAVSARGLVSRPHDSWNGAAIALAGGGVALVLGYLLFLEVLNPLFSRWFELDGRYPHAGPALVYALLALTALGVGLTAYGRFLAGRPAARASVVRAAVLLPVAAALGVAAAIWFGWTQDYSTAIPVVLVELLLVAAPCAGALWLARWWGLRAAAPELSEA
ncbi:hypothetical protein [Blastococcus sp. LR1]|uniref:hypothetical protein n=1 Tax=Blastococcus sp. LR1 TaxID=2877000 RepID=UPI001CCC1002|nr:hypothetical protein [Blastococcus sp. LR1]MCA0144080.1 hypothetical protein [Blastococcus sp. LR1]